MLHLRKKRQSLACKLQLLSRSMGSGDNNFLVSAVALDDLLFNFNAFHFFSTVSLFKNSKIIDSLCLFFFHEILFVSNQLHWLYFTIIFLFLFDLYLLLRNSFFFAIKTLILQNAHSIHTNTPGGWMNGWLLTLFFYSNKSAATATIKIQ